MKHRTVTTILALPWTHDPPPQKIDTFLPARTPQFRAQTKIKLEPTNAEKNGMNFPDLFCPDSGHSEFCMVLRGAKKTRTK